MLKLRVRTGLKKSLLLRRRHSIRCGKRALELGARTYVMGVLNRTPDSFSDGGIFMDEDRALGRIMQMAREGADVIDIGGESTRPGSAGVSAQEELGRVIPVLERAAKETDIPISIDTSKHEVAEEALKKGACIVNDITGLKGDPAMAGVAARYGAAVIVMHMKGRPRDMQENPHYDDIVGEIMESLEESISIAVGAGIEEDKIVVDPGIGFGKTADHNLEILRRLSEFSVLEKPVLVGVSRKSFIGKALGKEVKDRLMGTAASCAMAIANGAHMIRVHDVKEMAEVARMTDAILGD